MACRVHAPIQHTKGRPNKEHQRQSLQQSSSPHSFASGLRGGRRIGCANGRKNYFLAASTDSKMTGGTILLLALPGAMGSPSGGCSAPTSPAPAPGSTFSLVEEFGGVEYSHLVTVPPEYGIEGEPQPTSLIMYFHGWGAGARSCGDFCEAVAPSAGFMTVSLQVEWFLKPRKAPAKHKAHRTKQKAQHKQRIHTRARARTHKYT